jgi:muconate cycloisomerase
VTLFVVRIPFKQPFRHALATRHFAENVIVQVRSQEGVVGYGEALPREYVTGESVASVLDSLQRYWAPLLWDQEWKSPAEVLPFLASWHDLMSQKFKVNDSNMLAARCAIELALLDALGKFFNINSAKLLNMDVGLPELRYSGVISGDSLQKAKRKAFLMKLYGFRDVKLKVGGPDDLERVRSVRGILGPKRNLRVDANGAWSAEQALEKIRSFEPYRLSAVEQPVPKNDLAGLRRVKEGSSIPIVADESCCSLKEAKLLCQTQGCDILNIRLSKCGGLYYAKEIAALAHQAQLGIQLGCQVGETAILASAGRIFAQCHPELKFLEGAYERFLLQHDIAKKPVRFYYGGRAKPCLGPGLGIEVDEEGLSSLVIQTIELKRS